MIRIEYELPLAGHDCDYKANTPLLLPFLKCTDQFLIKTKTFPRSETELNREGIQYVLRKRYEKFENENFLLRPWFDYVKDRQLGLIRGWCRVDIGLIKGYRGVTWPLMMTNSLISSPIIFCWGHFRHLAPSHPPHSFFWPPYCSALYLKLEFSGDERSIQVLQYCREMSLHKNDVFLSNWGGDGYQVGKGLKAI